MLNADIILQALRDKVTEGKIIGKESWLAVAFDLNSLLLDENAKLFDLEQQVAKMKVVILSGQEKKSVAAATLEVEASDLYKETRTQEAKILQILEFVRIAKRQGEIF